jgi:hypothetical protein
MKATPSIKSETETIYSFNVTSFMIFKFLIYTTAIKPFSPTIKKFYASIFLMILIPEIMILFLGPTLTYRFFTTSI